MIEPRANPDLFGQERAWTVVTQALGAGRLPHAWLLAGPRGIGKATLAWRFARRLLTRPSSGTEGREPGPADPLFRQIAQGSHPDARVLELPRDPKTGRWKGEIGVDAVRQATASLHATAALGGRRVLVVDGAEALNRNAANALLKTLEEPPAGVVILLVSHDPARLLPTVRSRCALLRLARLEPAVIERILERHAPALDPERRAPLARIAQGSAGRALDLAHGGLDLYERLTLTLGAARIERDAVHDLAQRLQRDLESRGGDGGLGLLQILVGRVVAAATGRLDGPLFASEPAALRRLVERRPLDQWPGLWEKVARLMHQADLLNLDRGHALLLVLAGMAGATAASGLPGRAPTGGLDAVG